MSILPILIILSVLHEMKSDTTTTENNDIQFLNELPLHKLLKLKHSLRDLSISTTEYEHENITVTTPSYLESFGAQAMALKAPKRKSDHEEIWHKGDSKISNIFSMSVTTLAFLAFGGYLLCLIVQAVKAKQMYLPATTVQPATIFVSNIKKRPQVHSQVASYGRRRRATTSSHSGRIDPSAADARELRRLHLPPEQLFEALLQLCEGYAKWSGRMGRLDSLLHSDGTVIESVPKEN